MTNNNKQTESGPVFRAERYHGEEITGDYLKDREMGQSYIVEIQSAEPHPVKPETLQISFDGKEFYSMSECRDALEMLRKKKTSFPCLSCSKNEWCKNIGKMIVYECYQMREFKGGKS